MKKFYILFLLYVVLFNLYSCSGSKDSCEEKQTLKYTIVVGSGGGFAGAYEGKMIDSLGIIFSWEGRTFYTANKKVVDSLSQSQISNLNDYLNKNDFENYSFKEVRNMTTFLTIAYPSGNKTFSWKDTEISDRVPEKIRELYLKIKSVFNSKK